MKATFMHRIATIAGIVIFFAQMGAFASTGGASEGPHLEDAPENLPAKYDFENLYKGLKSFLGQMEMYSSVSGASEEPCPENKTEVVLGNDELENLYRDLKILRTELERLEVRVSGALVANGGDCDNAENVQKEDCPDCKGTGSVDCARCKGSGVFVRKESVACPMCSKIESGIVKKQFFCKQCKGSGHRLLKCLSCKGKGGKLCLDCAGVGSLNFKPCPKCDKGMVQCSNCDGRGIVRESCFRCGGMGMVYRLQDCPQCSGKGTVLQQKELNCRLCNGKGKVSCERCNGKGGL